MRTVITKKVRLVAAPEPPFVGTVFTVKIDDPADGAFKITSTGFAAGHTSVTIDWGDGTPSETFGDVIAITHAYEKVGTFKVKVSDDLATIGCQGSGTNPCGKKVLALKCTAQNLTGLASAGFFACSNMTEADFSLSSLAEIPGRGFSQCVGLTGEMFFPNVSALKGASSVALPFYKCAGVSVIHFAEANRAAIEATDAYKNDRSLGSGTAVVKFDL